jgi:replicative DNA helicase
MRGLRSDRQLWVEGVMSTQPEQAAETAAPVEESFDDESADPQLAAAGDARASPAPADWHIDVGGQLVEPVSALDVLGGLNERLTRGEVQEYQALALGFSPLDRRLGGGIRSGELMLIGGGQGTGKTTLALQMARNVALGGPATILFVCFEHDNDYLLNRLMAMESVLGGPMPPTAGLRLPEIRREVLGSWLAQEGDEAVDLAANKKLRPSIERIARYGHNLYLLRGSQTLSTVDNLRRLIDEHRRLAPDRQLLLFVDYLQKVPVIPDPVTETERVTIAVNGLKDIALSEGVAVVCVVAADREGLKASRLRNHHLRGSSAINYEADVIAILNEKYNIVAKVNIEFNPYQAQRFRDWIVLTIEKNRAGRDNFDLEFEKHFEYACFDPAGRQVQEKLIEERLYSD